MRLLATLSILGLLLVPVRSTLARDRLAYAKPELLATPEMLKAYYDGERDFFKSGVTLIDVRSFKEHAAGNLSPGYRIEIGAWKRAFGDGTDGAKWTNLISAVVADPKTTVIVYDNVVTPNAARTWWLLKYWGVADVRILNGGYQAAQAAGLRTYPTAEKISIPSLFRAKPQANRLATREQVLQAIVGDNGTKACVVDARSTQEVAGGKIPTAAHSDWTNYVDPKTGKIRSAAELKALLAEANFDPQHPAIGYCRSGGRAAVVVFAMELVGGQQVANYYGSWNEWSVTSGVPIVRPGVVGP